MISTEDVRRLLETAGSVLVVIEGHAEVVDAGDLGDGRLRGALEVASHDDLLARLRTARLTDGELAEQAEALNMAVAELGG